MNKIAMNKIAMNKIAMNKIAMNKVSANLVGAGDLLATADGREVYSYIVSCALPASQTVEAVVDGVTYDFPGGIGLAPGWADAPATATDKGWVSACMIARVNAFDISVEISLRGGSPALSVSPEERTTYTVQEGAFYGALFQPDDQPIQWYACRGSGQLHSITGELVERACARPSGNNDGLTVCGFTYTGDCGRYPHERGEPACDPARDGSYRECESPDDHEWEQVITTYVTE